MSSKAGEEAAVGRPVMYMDAAIYAAEDPFATALLVQDGQIAWMGTDTAASTLLSDTMDVVRLRGALIAPAFVDSHVHLSDLGRGLTGLDLTSAGSAADVLDAVGAAARSLSAAEVVLGAGWDESAWSSDILPTPQELAVAAGGREVYLARRDVHTALATPGLLAAAGASAHAEGPTGLTEAAHAAVRDAAMAGTAGSRRRWQRAALDSLAAAGHATVVEMASPAIGGREDLELLLGDPAGAASPMVHAYWAELVGDAATAADLAASFTVAGSHRRLAGLGGDLAVDGSLGARTAALHAPYADAPTCGELLLDVEAITEHVAACSAAGIQTALHVIGDAAVRAALDGIAAAARRVGEPEVRRLHHRLEHVEAVDPAGIEQLLRYGLTASVQPRFDELWGGQDGMYAARLGAERAAALNPFGTLSAAGVPMAFGSDAPVTGPRPWSALRAAMSHHCAQQRIPARAAFLAHTRAGHRAVADPDPLAGTLRWGSPATFAVWEPSELVVAAPDGDEASFSTDARARTPMLPDLECGAPRCLRTVRDGVVLFDAEALEY